MLNFIRIYTVGNGKNIFKRTHTIFFENCNLTTPRYVQCTISSLFYQTRRKNTLEYKFFWLSLHLKDQFIHVISFFMITTNVKGQWWPFLRSALQRFICQKSYPDLYERFIEVMHITNGISGDQWLSYSGHKSGWTDVHTIN